MDRLFSPYIRNSARRLRSCRPADAGKTDFTSLCSLPSGMLFVYVHRVWNPDDGAHCARQMSFLSLGIE